MIGFEFSKTRWKFSMIKQRHYYKFYAVTIKMVSCRIQLLILKLTSAFTKFDRYKSFMAFNMNDAERNTTLISRASVQALAGLIVVILSLHIIRMYRKLGHVPGPFLAKFTNFQRVYWVKSMQAHKIHLQMHEKYGDCVRYGPEMVSVSDPGAIPTLYPMRPGFPKVCIYKLELLLGNI